MKTNFGWGSKVAVVVACAAASACASGSDGNDGSANTGGTAGSGSSGSAGAGGGAKAGSGGAGGAGGSAGMKPDTPFVSNSPGLAQPPASAEGLVLVSSAFFSDSPGQGMIFNEWFGLVVNAGSTVVCYPKVDFAAKSGSTVLWKGTTYATGVTYTSSIGVRPCLAPGDKGGLYANDLGASLPSVSGNKVTDLTVDWSMSTTGTPALFTNTPALSGVKLTMSNPGYYVATGTLTGKGESVSNIRLDVFMLDASGLAFDRVGANNLNSLAPGMTWAFTTNSTKRAIPSQPLVFMSFLVDQKTMSLTVPVPEFSGHEAQPEALQVRIRKNSEQAALLRAEAGR